MSKYSMKHSHPVDCSERTCEEPASRLALIDSTPYWFCQDHFEQHQHELSA